MFSIMKTEGTRAEVMHGTARRTSGGLTKGDLKYNKSGRIVSKKKSQQAKKDKRLEKVTKSQLETFIKNHIEQTSKVNIEDGLKAKWS